MEKHLKENPNSKSYEFETKYDGLHSKRYYLEMGKVDEEEKKSVLEGLLKD